MCVAGHEQVQAWVNTKYSTWQQDILHILSLFGVKLERDEGCARVDPQGLVLKVCNSLMHRSIEVWWAVHGNHSFRSLHGFRRLFFFYTMYCRDPLYTDMTSSYRKISARKDVDDTEECETNQCVH